jgi:TPR repeat protein
VKKSALPLLVAWAVLTAAGPTLAGPYEEAKAAYDHGDNATAMQLWRLLAESGDANAQFWLGAMYDLGRGVAQDFTVASSWYRRAAEQGNPNAQHNLAHMYEMGQGLPGDYAMSAAVTWYRRAAEQGYAAAELNLGALYAQGRGVRRDYVQAYKWFTLAGSAAHRDFVAALLTPEQVTEADRLVHAWTAKPER